MSAWSPSAFIRYEGCAATSTGVARIVTDAGKAYIKALGNAEGPHALARELVGTRLADLIGLEILDHAILSLSASDEILLGNGKNALPGPAFVTRAVPGHSWGGTEKELSKIENRSDINRLVVFDTWIRNRDRYPPAGSDRKPNPDNVFLTSEGAKDKMLRLLAIDHTHCFMPGGSVTERISDISLVQDEAVYGLFPAFKPFVTVAGIESCLGHLRQLDMRAISDIMKTIPGEWEVGPAVRAAWSNFLVRRASYVADTLLERIKAVCWPGRLFDDGPKEASP